jgi:hypothetical protein
MSVVAVDFDGATIRLIEFQARKYHFGVVGLFIAACCDKQGYCQQGSR